MSRASHFVLNTGAKIPSLGLGTWRSTDKEVHDAVLTALNCGYRHIDTAAIYGNEFHVGRGIKSSSVPRSDIFLTTKLWNSKQMGDSPPRALDASLELLGVDYVDLYLMHWPVPLTKAGVPIPPTEWDFVKTWKSMEKLVETGKTKAIGVSNFTVSQLKTLLETADIIPAVNQVEMHPYLPQKALLDFAESKGIHITAYSPLGSAGGPLLQEPLVHKIAAKHGMTAVQVLIAWAIQRGTSAIPKSVTPARIVSNFQEFVLEEEDIFALGSLDKNQRYVKPTWAPYFDVE
ncbi:NADP-dependent oxidoreductase domain-containing protein [Limtongia smithiae]|uniref:NADP-dependent oxidoreductase domain-containing protein n=1 Tax=Limtongia smithiae TaxID=1125753 RepID=UPI0034CD0FC9